MKEARTTMVQLNQLLAETRESLKKMDAVLVEAQGIGANVRGATTDLSRLRADVDANLHKVEGMIDQLNRKWPFAHDTEVKVP
jgi:phospholipid/cholesterol/gamma-HCH transport system substrate-binding protein